ncbi:uncharacterized protein LOC141852180 isoform X2 [Brevipalpus obovatus]|uniref:uncharacterized protein LOC141852180 isoform X2 n=1 Tax=Brevipalpus obovatus TaxID=246614 RepID=UPI003D9F409E
MDLDLPGGVITTHCVSTVVRPGSKQTHDPLQFVKIQSTELSKKAVEQIRLAEEVKITKEKIKEVEEEWQNNLLNWKSKRRKSRSSGAEEDDAQENSHRKIKTFSEILNEKAKSGHRIGYNLHKYVGLGDEEGENDGDDEFGNKKEGTKESSNKVGFLASTYEEQQAQLQKKREELSNKLQELQELENKQRELERQEKGGKNTLNSEEFVMANNIHRAIDPETGCDSNQILINKETRQSPEAIVDDNHHQNDYSINHGEILETNEKNRDTSLTQPGGAFSGSDESESENDHPDEHTEIDEEAEREQMLSFKAKLSTFENLSKSKIDEEQLKPKTAPLKTRFQKSISEAQIDINNKSERPIYMSRPPTVEDLVRSEKLAVTQRRRQTVENNGGLSDNDQINHRRLERENHQTFNVHLGTDDLKSRLGSTYGSRGIDASKFHPSGPEDNRGSWDQQNYVCDKEVEIISERMNRLPGSSNESTMLDNSSAPSYGTVPKFVPQACDIGLPPLKNVQLSFCGQSVPNEAAIFSNVHQQQQYLGPEQFQQQRPRCRQPISNQGTHLANAEELYANQNQFAAQKQMPSLPTHMSATTQRDSLNPQFIYSNQFFDPRTSQVNVPIKTQEPVLSTIYQPPHGYESHRQRPCFYPPGDMGNVFLRPFESSHGTRNLDEPLSSSASQQNSLPDRNPHPQQIGKSQSASNMGSQRHAYNHNHWVIQEAELRRLHSKGSNIGHIKNTAILTNNPQSSLYENHVYENTSVQNSYSCNHQTQNMRGIEMANSTLEGSQQQTQILSVSGKKKCSNCGDELGRGCAAMVIETLSLYYHINCFRCFVCHTQLGNGSCGTDVRVRNQKLHCHNCYSNDEAGLKFSRV